MKDKHTSAGFTLIEVIVALAILGWVMGSSIFIVKQYADQRIVMRERFHAGQVAWNQLMEEYRVAKGMVAPTERGRRESEGVALSGNQEWEWSVDFTNAAGDNLYQYKVEAGLPGSERSSATRTLYLVRKVTQ